MCAEHVRVLFVRFFGIIVIVSIVCRMRACEGCFWKVFRRTLQEVSKRCARAFLERDLSGKETVKLNSTQFGLIGWLEVMKKKRTQAELTHVG